MILRFHDFLYIFLILFSPFLNGDYAKDKKVIICGIIKNGEESFLSTKKDIEEIASFFKDYRIVIYENNSVDQTKKLYQSWAKRNSKLIFMAENLDQQVLDKQFERRGDFRIGYIARARNIVLDRIAEPQFDDFDYVIMLDLDSFKESNLDELKNIIENPMHDWDAVFANGAYDILALRSREFPFSPELMGNNKWVKMVTTIRMRLIERLEQEGWLPVDSAFGGLAIYKKKAIMSSRYSWEVTDELKSLYKDYMRQHKENYSSDKSLLGIERLFTKNILANPYICEHVNLHLIMKKNGFGKLFIDKNLIRKSACHEN